MKRNLLLISLISIFGLKEVNAQFQQPLHASDYLSAGNIKAPVSADGPLFWDKVIFGSNPNYNLRWEAPKGSGESTIFASSLWIGGMDYGNQLYLATETFRQAYGSTKHISFFFGPVANTYNASFDARYNKVWKVTAAQIQYHQQNYRRRLYVMPDGIANWPAHGDVTNGEAANLAPFADVNQDGFYDPANGDYPVIRGAEALYFILNDKRYTKTPLTPALNVEVHGMAYAFDNPADSALYNTVFVNYRLINRSGRNYQDFYAGIWSDFDIGNNANDRLSSDVGRNAYFAYNAVPFDSSVIINNAVTVLGYGATPPAQGVAFLGNNKLNAFISYDNSNSPINGDPRQATDYYNFLRGIWRNNQPVTFGGYGINTTSSPYRYMFPGTSDPTGTGFSSSQTPPYDWSMANLNGMGSTYKGDVRGVGSIGPFNLNAGQEICFDVAFPFAQGNDNLHSVRVLKRYIDQINQFHTNTYGNGCIQNQRVSNPATSQRHTFESFFPNPARKEITLHFDQRLTDDVTVSVYDINGKKQSTSILQKEAAAVQTISLENLKSGVYILNMVDGKSSEKIRVVVTE